jgi:hypothetical protein
MSQENIEIVRRGYEAFNRRDFDAATALMRPDVLVRQQFFARGAGSGIELDVGSWAVWTLDDEGLVARGEMFMLDQEAQALEAAGLSE